MGNCLWVVSLWVLKRIVVLPWYPVLVRDPLGLVLARGAAGRLALGALALSFLFLLGGVPCLLLFVCVCSWCSSVSALWSLVLLLVSCPALLGVCTSVASLVLLSC